MREDDIDDIGGRRWGKGISDPHKIASHSLAAAAAAARSVLDAKKAGWQTHNYTDIDILCTWVRLCIMVERQGRRQAGGWIPKASTRQSERRNKSRGSSRGKGSEKNADAG